MPTMAPAGVGLGAKDAHDGGDRNDFQSCAQHNDLAPLEILGLPACPTLQAGANSVQASKNIPRVARNSRKLRKIFRISFISQVAKIGCMTKD
jgi:hypothetical protein